ncbi:MAG: hypothetical protein H7X77_04000 [Anaerolineae bacterium]|nr:hypothetical protein [Anaerolineae bacterium]
MMNIWEFSNQLSQRLFRWNLLNILSGLWLASRGGFWRGFGSQNIGWGIINIAIAAVGSIMMRRRYKTLPDPNTPTIQRQESRSLKRLLLLNAGLDIFYMLGGWRFARSRTWNDYQAQGIGYGIIIQGLLLFIFDLTQAAQVPPEVKS